MSEEKIQHKVVTALRRARRGRQRQRILAIGILASVAIGIFSVLGFNYTKKRNQRIAEARGIQVEYTMPSIPTVPLPVESPKTPNAPIPQPESWAASNR